MGQEKDRPKPVTAADRDGMPHYGVAEDVDPLAVLLAEREEDGR
ncbi:hypothetical protein ACFY3N_13700 [Streptomyces sp. NPDC000348]